MIRLAFLRLSSTVALVGLFALTACSGDDKEGSDGAEPVDGPVTAILRAAWGDYGAGKRAGQDAEAENLVAECMATEGFEYVPRDDSSTGGTVSEEDVVDQNTEEWIAQYGYGIVMSWEMTNPTVAGEEPVEQVDPNAAYLIALSESEAIAYHRTLYGKQPAQADEEMETSVDRWEDGGCWGWAQHEVAGEELAPTEDPRFTDLLESMSTIYTEGAKDPRVLDAAAEWADCMADAGYTGLTTPDSGANSLWAKTIFHDETGNSVTPSQAAIAEFRELEISTALTDFRCTEEVDWAGVRAQVHLEGEELWIKDNKVALDEYAAALQEYLT